MSQPRVVITGVGIVSAFGAGFARNIEAIFGDHTAIGPLTLVDVAGARVATAGQVPEGALAPGPPGASRADRMAITAATEALGDLSPAQRGATGLFVGGTMGGMLEAEPSLAELTARPAATGFDPTCIPGHVLTSPTDRVNEVIGPFASSHTVCSACSGGAAAIALAAAAIRCGRLPRALAGGVDALSRMTLAGFASLMALDLAPCRPFDAGRAGLSLGEGAAFLLLEREDLAAERGAVPVAEVAGWALAAEAHHPTQPAPDGRIAESTMRRALDRAGLPHRVDYVNAHGTATPANDATEAAAIARAFGAAAVSSSKGHIGHTLAAAGAIEAAVTAAAIHRGRLPPTAGLDVVDPACAALDHVRVARAATVDVAISNAFGFGGTDVVLALRGVDPKLPRLDAPQAEQLVVTAVATHGALDPSILLDPARSRRFDRASRLATWVASIAMRSGPASEQTGVVVGSAFGAVEATGRLLRELFEKGPRFVSPAIFPTILPSALAANASMYLGLRGPALSCADLGASAEAALALAALLLDDAQADAMLVVAVEEASEVARLVSSPRISGLDGPHRGEGSCALLLERRPAADRRGAKPLAILEERWSFRGRRPELPAPRGTRPIVLTARHGLASPPGWPGPPRVVETHGHHESAGGVALATAVHSIASGEADEALVLGHAPDRGHAFLFSAPS